MARSRTRREMMDWLSTHVRLDGDCRIWAGSLDTWGRPVVCWQPRGQRISARLLLLELLGKPIPPRPVVWQACGCGQCMEPSHLMIGTRPAMIAWMARQNRFPTGPARAIASARNRPSARLGMRHARDVATAIAHGAPRAQIAVQYGVTVSAVGHALARWRKAGVIA